MSAKIPGSAIDATDDGAQLPVSTPVTRPNWIEVSGVKSASERPGSAPPCVGRRWLAHDLSGSRQSAARSRLLGGSRRSAINRLAEGRRDAAASGSRAQRSRRETLVVVGKALFWDVQIGSDGRTACATCHFHAGAYHASRMSWLRGWRRRLLFVRTRRSRPQTSLFMRFPT